ncbi:hypothetical protein EDD80_102234 [Anseongella ginsenosidimutans]|uniref:Uncharacterized protein n=1 Tax=Anseongella ginsenosidimutans TaxID=496056 RepID=A0A4R3KYH1_9SPHI|nr:hypothetical protein EDD80_102234 [Anseongella ginsenosidimutans]
MFNLKKFQQKSPQERFLLILGGLMIIAYTIIGCMFIFYEPMQKIIRQDTLRKIAGVCIILYAVIRFSKLRNIYLDD